MEFLLQLRLQILPLDASIARLAKRTVQLVVMPLAVWVVVQNVEVCRLKGLFARLAHEALFVVSARKSTVRRADGFTFDDLATTSAVSFVPACGSSGWRRPLGWYLSG